MTEIIIDNHKFQIYKLDIKNKKKIINYEKALFNAFIIQEENRWIKNNYKISNNERLTPSIPYDNLDLYIVEYQESVLVGGAVNANYNSQWQLEQVGFDVKDYKKQGNAEALHLFYDKSIKVNANPFGIMIPLRNYLLNDLANRGIHTVYGDCLENKTIFYKKFKFNILEEKIIDSEKNYLLNISTNVGVKYTEINKTMLPRKDSNNLKFYT